MKVYMVWDPLDTHKMWLFSSRKLADKFREKNEYELSCVIDEVKINTSLRTPKTIYD